MTLEPMVYWIGPHPLEHGERGRELDPEHDEACLCGHPDYLMCPNFDDGIQGWTISLGEQK